MPDLDKTTDLTSLQERYEIVSELRCGGETRTYAAIRRADGIAVEVTMVAAAAGDTTRALAHFASDATLLASHPHPAIVPVVEGKWTSADCFAVVRDRIDGVTLGELLSRGELLTNPRIAVILQEVLGALEWARAHGVVHRAVTPAAVWFERGSNRSLVAFAPMPISIQGVADTADDARTVGGLARAMLSGKPHLASTESLASLRPQLATRVLEETTAMLAGKTGGPVPDVAAYIATVAMGDALRSGEIEMATLEAELTETHRAIRAQWESERAEAERKAAEAAERYAREQAVVAKQMADERARLDADRLVVDQRRAEVEQELVALAEARAMAEQRVADLEAERAAVDQLRTDVEQRLVEERQTMEELLAAKAVDAAPAGAAFTDRAFVGSVPIVPEPPSRYSRRTVSVVGGSAVLLLVVLIALSRHESASFRAAHNVIVPESALTRLGPIGPVPAQDPNFLTRSENGSVVLSFPSLTDSVSTVVTEHRDEKPALSHAVLMRPHVSDSAIVRRDSTRRDSLAKQDTTVRRDTLSPSFRR